MPGNSGSAEQLEFLFEPRSKFRFGYSDQDNLWRHMFKLSIVRLGPASVYLDRKAELVELEDAVTSGRFRPSMIGYLCAPKQNGVARFIPVHDHRTTTAYFACVRAIDDDCANLAVEGTYGGWSLGGKRRKTEAAAAKELFEEPLAQPALIQDQPPAPPQLLLNTAVGEPPVEDDDFAGVDISGSAPAASYNKAAWFENWQEYWKILAATTEQDDADTVFVTFDLANFYDSVDLNILRSKLEPLPGCSDEMMKVLFELLTVPAGVGDASPARKCGLPQDVIGDSSRVLANYFLVEFDNVFLAAVQEVGGKYLRWADDITFTCKSLRVARDLIYLASQKLHGMGLNINTGKVKIRKLDQFRVGWGFDIMDKLLDPERAEAGMMLLKDRWDREGYDRRDTALRSALRMLRERKDLVMWRQWASAHAMSMPDFVNRLDSAKIHSLVTISDSPTVYAAQVCDSIMSEPFTQPKCHLLRYLERQRHNSDAGFRNMYENVQEAMLGSGHPILIQAAKYSPYEGERP